MGQAARKQGKAPGRVFQASMKAQPYLAHAQLCTIYADKKLVLFQRGKRGGEGVSEQFPLAPAKGKKAQSIKKKQFPQAKYRSRNGEESDVSITFT